MPKLAKSKIQGQSKKLKDTLSFKTDKNIESLKSYES